MAVLEIKGVRVGEGRPKTIVPLIGSLADDVLEQARSAVAAGADCVEWRIDFARDPQDHAGLVRLAHDLANALPQTPLIATFRSASQGGQLDLPAEQYRELVRAIVCSGAPDIVDVELGLPEGDVADLVRLAHGRGMRVIVSHHDFCGTPSVAWMVEALARMASLGADIPKIAVMAHAREDAAALMYATAQATRMLDKPLLTMAMGQQGVVTRLAGEAFGSALTFCSLGEASAPGQVGLVQAQALIGQLHGVLGAS